MPKFVPRERKHKKIARVQKASSDGVTTNTNSAEIVPESRSEREERRDALKADLASTSAKTSSKKRKRLDKYIDTKLRKDENAALIKKLEVTQQGVDTSLLRSSKKLGRVSESKRERLHRALQEREAGIHGLGDEVLLEPRRHEEYHHAESDEDDDDEMDVEHAEQLSHDVAASVIAPAIDGSGDAKGFGAGLKRPIDLDISGRPVLQKRKRRKGNKSEQSYTTHVDDKATAQHAASHSDDHMSEHDQSSTEHEEEWEGFGSDTSEQQELNSTSEASSQSSSHDSSSDEAPAQRVSAFKSWANSQRNIQLDFTPSASTITPSVPNPANFKPRAPSPDLLPTSAPLEGSVRPASAITIPRTASIQAARLELPVVQEEQKILETINNNPVTVVCGATGSGKTTQIPQMLLENGYGSRIGAASDGSAGGDEAMSRGMIGVTQPRRVAATSVASRVSHEMAPYYSSRVAHQVRYDTSVSRDTAIKFMTDGILLREIQQDFILSKYSVIIIDEAHERSVNTDILIGMLSRIVPLRAQLAKEEPGKAGHYPLKLIIMSATLSHGADSFLKNEQLWSQKAGHAGIPPVVEAEGRQYPVTVHFSRKTRRDYVSEVVEKVARGHRKLPAGGMLVFLTGQLEIQTVAKRLRERLGGGRMPFLSGKENTSGDVDDYEDGPGTQRVGNGYLEGEDASDSDAEIQLDEHEDTEFDIPQDEAPPPTLQHLRGLNSSGPRAPLKPHILPLYAALPVNQQLKVFQAAQDGHRIIVLATNVAETSLTIPGIRYVFDSGRAKEKKYKATTGVQTFEVNWVSKASAEQRKGRAGRTGAGHVWRLYSSAIHERYFEDVTEPEIKGTPLESTVLQLVGMGIENVLNFPFPTPPAPEMLLQAERLLRNLGAIGMETVPKVTDIGREIMRFPVNPRFGKMLWRARQFGLLEHAVALVAGLAVGNLFIPESLSGDAALTKKQESPHDSDDSEHDMRARRQADSAANTVSQQRHQAYTRAQAKLACQDPYSDAMKLLTAIGAHAQTTQPPASFCKEFWLGEKGMEEVQMLRKQLWNVVSSGITGNAADTLYKPTLATLSGKEKEKKALNEIVAAGFLDQIAVRADTLKDTPIGRIPNRAIDVAYRTLMPSTDEIDVEGDRTLDAEEQEQRRSVFVHSSSVLARLSAKEMPQFIIYSHLSTVDGTKRTRLHPLTVIGPRALAALAEGTPLLDMGKPIGKIEELGLGQRQCWVSVGLKADGTSTWPLGACKVLQRRGHKGWDVEKIIAR